MSYSSQSIGTTLRLVNSKYFLPAIQRPYVWNTPQLIALFDSLMKEYPISSFMFWNIEDETKKEVQIYKFIENYGQNVLNETATPDGKDITLVLDGQQRMTSLLIGLQGTYSEKAKGARRTTASAWTANSLYLDLLKDPDPKHTEEDPEADFGVTYGFSFLAKQPVNNSKKHWIKASKIMDLEDPEKLEIFIERMVRDFHPGVSEWEKNLAVSTLRKFHAVIWKSDSVNFYTEFDQSPDRVLDIFVRANDGGVKLSKADLLMSMITSKWSATSARDEIEGFVKHLSVTYGFGSKLKKDLILKACLVCCEQDVVYNVKNFTRDVINDIEENWDRIRSAIQNTFDLLNRHGIRGDNLGSLNATLPIVYYLYRTQGFDFRGTSEFERLNAEEIHYWLLNSLMVSAFVGHSDQTIATARATIRTHLEGGERSFPKEKLFSAMARGGRLSKVDHRTIEEILYLEYKSPRAFIALSLIYPDRNWLNDSYHVDHIIPQSDAQKNILRGRNISEHLITDIMGSVNRLGNLQLLRSDENIEKSDLPFRSWITGRHQGYYSDHMIPQQLELADVLKLPDFVRARENLMRQRLEKVLGLADA
ncbi:MAG: DUF262 domain-containing protein [Alteromonadaceae bacterium]|nr:DUF262 domain-containing protein [Alteromonadaceae bacterium]